MTNQVTRYNLRPCPDCNDTGNYEMGNARIADTCKTCEGLRYIPAPVPEDKPAAGMLYVALVELERTKGELAAARAEVERLRAALQKIADHKNEMVSFSKAWDIQSAFARLEDIAENALEGED